MNDWFDWVMGSLVLVVVALVLILSLLIAAAATGNIDREYRCVHPGVVETHKTYFGHEVAQWQPVVGVSGACD